MLKKIRTDGPYEIYGDESGQPLQLVPDRLDTSLSLGLGKLHQRGRHKGLRSNDALIEDTIARYAVLWKQGVRPQILVQGLKEGGRLVHSSKVVDGAMWVSAAMRCGAEHVPVYVVTFKGASFMHPEAIWLYFNVRHGLVPTEKEISEAITTLAKRASRDGMSSDEFLADYSVATGLPQQMIKTPAMQSGAWATKRTKEQLEEDKRDLARGVPKSEIAARRKVSRRAVTKLAKRLAASAANGEAAAPAPPAPPAPQAPDPKSIRTYDDIVRVGRDLKPHIAGYVECLDKLMERPAPDVASAVEALSADQCLAAWKAVEQMWVQLTELGLQLGVFAIPEVAHEHRSRVQKIIRQMQQALVVPGSQPRPTGTGPAQITLITGGTP
jgi:hypothetical protein